MKKNASRLSQSDSSTENSGAREMRNNQSVTQSLDNQAMQYLLGMPPTNAGVKAPALQPRVHENSLSQQFLRSTGKVGAALGQDIFLANNLNPQKRARVLGHELRHTKQVQGREANFSKPIQQGRQHSDWEKNAAAPGQAVSPGADAQTLRFFGEDEVCSTDETADASTYDPNSTYESDTANASFPEPLACEAEPAAYPDNVDVPTLRNDELNSESLSVDAWFTANSETSHPDLASYTSYRARLKAERTTRVQNGHMWLTTAVSESPDTFYMLQAGGDTTHIISVYPDIALGVPAATPPGPIMTVTQFEDHMGGMGIPIYTEEEYLALLQQNGLAIGEESTEPLGRCERPSPMLDPDIFPSSHGYLGGISMLDTRASLISHTLPYGSAPVRAGDLGEAFGMSGFLGSNYNSAGRGWSGDILRPLRPMRGNDPVADMRVFSGSPFDDLSLKVTQPDAASFTSPNDRTRFSNYLSGHVDILDTSATKFQDFASSRRPGVPLADVSDGLGLAIPENHVADYRALLMDPLGRGVGDRGTPARNLNYDQGPLRAIYSLTRFPVPIALSDGSLLVTGADLYAARTSGRVSQVDFEAHIQTIGNAAATRVVAIPGFHTGTISWYESYRNSLGTTNSRDLRAALNPDTLQTLELIRQRQQLTNPDAPFVATSGRSESLRVGARNGVYGGLGRATFSVAGDLIFNDAANLSDPAYRDRLMRTTAIEGTAGFVSETGESYLRSQAGLAMAREGMSATAPRALAMRLGARAVPGVVDAIVEGIDMGTDGRENSTEEIVVRTGRAAVIGGGSAWAGAAVGTAIGGPIGFVVGFGVGAFVGWLGNRVLPGGREHWEEQERIRLRVEEMERRVAELERQMEAARLRRERLDTPLDTEAASVAGVEGLFGFPTSNPLFMSSSADYTPSVGELESEYLISSLNSAESRR